jgi:Na+-transporting NADH:ubiquinone oxidoreductase subunit C
MARDSVLGTFTVATVLCLVCSLVVSSAARILEPIQQRNKKVDVQKNVLLAAGLLDGSAKTDEITSVYEQRITPVAVKLGTTEVADVAEDYDPAEARGNAKQSTEIKVDGPKPGVARRENVAFVYQVKDGDKIDSYVLPIYGKGLWSTLYGFIALDADGETVVGISYYEHGETPGLGGEVENETWKAKWKGKQVYDEQGEPSIELVKTSAGAENQIDALSGATITSNGVENMVNYWLGPDAFGPYLKAQTEAGQ